jgi:aspartate/methionine/tyrosine aminotransferase
MVPVGVDAKSLPAMLPQAPTEVLREVRARMQAAHGTLKSAGLKLNLTRGKPATEQVALADRLLTQVSRAEDCIAEDGTDCRNYYGSPQGLIEVRRLFAPILGAPAEQILVGNNSSLALMHDAIVFALLKGMRDGATPWGRGGVTITFLCPSPGYDRHFAICERYGIRMLPVRLTGQGPDMDEVERLVADPQVKGMWCVPKYSNPTGETYSAEVVERLARMPVAADDFRLFWDNAYAVHHLTETPDQLENILDACTRAGNPDRPLVFASTSKVTFAQAGLGLFAASPANMAWFVRCIGVRTIGPDKLNQLRHARAFGDAAGIARHMERHRKLIAPKFEAVIAVLRARLGATGAASWSEPKGGYFISLDVLPGCAKRVAELARECGVEVVPAGRTFPYGRDPNDSNIRIAPTFPPVEEVRQAAEALATCTLLAAAEQLLRARGIND